MWLKKKAKREKGVAAIRPGDWIEEKEVTATWRETDEDGQELIVVRLWDGRYNLTTTFPASAIVWVQPRQSSGQN